MDASEYIDTVVGQMRCRRAKGMVAKELSDHINDQKEDFLRHGMNPGEAEAEAVRQMGDAVGVGLEMDRLHRPAMDTKTLVVIGALSLGAMALQTFLLRLFAVDISIWNAIQTTTLQIIIGLVIMTGILFLDYTILGKKPVIVWLIFLLIPVLCYVTYIPDWLGSRVIRRMTIFLLLAIALPAFAALVWYYRTQRWKGALKTGLWLAAALVTHFLFGEEGISLIIFTAISGLLLFSYALAKGWYHIPKAPSLILLWSIAAGGGILLLIHICTRNDYVAKRIGAFLGFAAGDMQGVNYLSANMREAMGNLQMWGRGTVWSTGGKPLEAAMSFFAILNEKGILLGIVCLSGLTVLFLCMAKGVSRQKNVLGSLLGMACILGMVIPTVGHVLTCLTLLPFTDAYIPFLYPGWIPNLTCYALLGLYLSVYRYKDVVA